MYRLYFKSQNRYRYEIDLGKLVIILYRTNYWWRCNRGTSYVFYFTQSTEGNSRFPGRGRTLGETLTETVSANNSDSSLQARLLESGNSPVHPSSQEAIGVGQQRNNRRYHSEWCNSIVTVILSVILEVGRWVNWVATGQYVIFWNGFGWVD